MELEKQAIKNRNNTSFCFKVMEGITFFQTLLSILGSYISHYMIIAIKLQKNLNTYWLQIGLIWHCKRWSIGVRFHHKKTPEN